ncbi:eukaryotic translation initiation factor 4E type 2-like [Etheostoma cragini]|uniref:eukaryotic translation initiation factor 4E type 2-like n=1 Tax=Etheostoma cragini TaxID=417921 RepID=UPI00155E5B51|nr:eukaryotic translation initiation factor 4E type 2-like [Etheostoma cragini]
MNSSVVRTSREGGALPAPYPPGDRCGLVTNHLDYWTSSKGLASRFWENIILAMLGEQFMVGGEICGAVVSIRFQEDILSIWNRTSNDQTTTSRIRDTLRRVLNLPTNSIMEYKTHTDSLRDNSSFRNTKISL